MSSNSVLCVWCWVLCVVCCYVCCRSCCVVCCTIIVVCQDGEEEEDGVGEETPLSAPWDGSKLPIHGASCLPYCVPMM